MKPIFTLILVAIFGFNFSTALCQLSISLTDSSINICSGENAIFEFTDLVGEPDTLVIEFDQLAIDSGFKSKFYDISTDIQSTSDTSGTFLIVVPDTADAGTYNAILFLKLSETFPDTTYYSDTIDITITIFVQANAGLDGSLEICEGDTMSTDDLFIALGEGAELNGSWEPSSIEEGIFRYTYTVINACGTKSSTIDVIEQEAPNAGVDNTLEVCKGDTLTTDDLFSALGEGTDVDGLWKPPIHEDIKLYEYTVTNACGSASSEVKIIVELEPPNAGTDGIIEICKGDTFTTDYLLSALGEGTDEDGSWEPSIEEDIFRYTYTVTNACGTKTSIVDVIRQVPPNAGEDGLIKICMGDATSDKELFDALGGNPDDNGTWSYYEGNEEGFTYTVLPIDPCTEPASANVVIDRIPQPTMDSIIAKPFGNESVLIFPIEVSIENNMILVGSLDGIDTLYLDDGGYLYIPKKYRIHDNRFMISFNTGSKCSGYVEYVYPNNSTQDPSSFDGKLYKYLEEDQFIVFPNPARSQFSIEFNPLLTGSYNSLWIKIYSLSGSCVFEAQITRNLESVNIESLSAGIYFVELSNSDMRFTPKKLIISK